VAAPIKKKSRVFQATLALSVLVHLVLFMQTTDLFRITSLSTLELALRDEFKPSFRHIPRPPKKQKPPDETPRDITEKPVQVLKPSLPDIRPDTRVTVPVSAADTQGLAAVPEGIITGVAGGISPAGTGFGSANDYYQMVQVKIESRKQYPATARQQNQEGRVTVYFAIGLDGGISDLKIVKGSRFKALDQAALEAVKNCVPFPRPPPALFQDSLKLQLTLVFELT